LPVLLEGGKEEEGYTSLEISKEALGKD